MKSRGEGASAEEHAKGSSAGHIPHTVMGPEFRSASLNPLDCISPLTMVRFGWFAMMSGMNGVGAATARDTHSATATTRDKAMAQMVTLSRLNASL